MDEDFTPNWKPLEKHLGQYPALMAHWMWMFRSGTGLEYYKHFMTRRYLVLDHEGNAYEPIHEGSWRQTIVEFQTAYDKATGRAQALPGKEHNEEED